MDIKTQANEPGVDSPLTDIVGNLTAALKNIATASPGARLVVSQSTAKLMCELSEDQMEGDIRLPKLPLRKKTTSFPVIRLSDEEREKVAKIRVVELRKEFGDRAINAFGRSDIHTLGDLSERNFSEILELGNVGLHTARKIETVVNNKGLELKPEGEVSVQ